MEPLTLTVTMNGHVSAVPLNHLGVLGPAAIFAGDLDLGANGSCSSKLFP